MDGIFGTHTARRAIPSDRLTSDDTAEADLVDGLAKDGANVYMANPENYNGHSESGKYDQQEDMLQQQAMQEEESSVTGIKFFGSTNAICAACEWYANQVTGGAWGEAPKLKNGEFGFNAMGEGDPVIYNKGGLSRMASDVDAMVEAGGDGGGGEGGAVNPSRRETAICQRRRRNVTPDYGKAGRVGRIVYRR